MMFSGFVPVHKEGYYRVSLIMPLLSSSRSSMAAGMVEPCNPVQPHLIISTVAFCLQGLLALESMN